jgi:prophage regulatory protein
MDSENLMFLRRNKVEAMTGLGRSSIYARMANGTFPKPVKLSTRMVRWVSSDIQGWLNDRIAESRGVTQ